MSDTQDPLADASADELLARYRAARAEVDHLTQENSRLLGVLRDRPVTWVCTCGRMNSGPACDFCPRVTTLPEQLLAITPGALTKAVDAFEHLHGRIIRDLDCEAHEGPPPVEEYWARVVDDLVSYANELYEGVLTLVEPTAVPPLIRTADQLRALPVDTIIMSLAGVAFQVEALGKQSFIIPARLAGAPYMRKHDGNMADLLKHAPFRVLHTPVVPDGR